jgi:hypothetical protein
MKSALFLRRFKENGHPYISKIIILMRKNRKIIPIVKYYFYPKLKIYTKYAISRELYF